VDWRLSDATTRRYGHRLARSEFRVVRTELILRTRREPYWLCCDLLSDTRDILLWIAQSLSLSLSLSLSFSLSLPLSLSISLFVSLLESPAPLPPSPSSHSFLALSFAFYFRARIDALPSLARPPLPRWISPSLRDRTLRAH